jgi:hypothetical protein
MKTLGRILIILLVAAIAVGGTYALLQTSLAQALTGQALGSGGENGKRPALSDFANGQGAPAGEMGGGDHESRSGSWETVGRNLLEIAAIVAAAQVAWSIGRWLKRTAAALIRKDRLNPGRS